MKTYTRQVRKSIVRIEGYCLWLPEHEDHTITFLNGGTEVKCHGLPGSQGCSNAKSLDLERWRVCIPCALGRCQNCTDQKHERLEYSKLNEEYDLVHEIAGCRGFRCQCPRGEEHRKWQRQRQDATRLQAKALS